MTAQDQIAFKNKLKQFCIDIIEQRITTAKQSINNAQEAANSEEKSSAGDKYETSRAMGHLQKDMHARQLTEYLKELADLNKVNSSIIYNHATAGAFIATNQSSFFIAAGLGKQLIEEQTIFFLSPKSPLAIAIQHKKAGEEFVFNKNVLVIKEIF